MLFEPSFVLLKDRAVCRMNNAYLSLQAGTTLTVQCTLHNTLSVVDDVSDGMFDVVSNALDFLRNLPKQAAPLGL